MGKKILFICGSLNQTKMMHKISSYLSDFECFFSPYYATGFIGSLARTPLLNFSILGGQFRTRTLDYLETNNLKIDDGGNKGNYDLVFTCSDLIIPSNIKGSKIILVQEGMTDPENLIYYIVKLFHLPRWMASTSTTGLSHAYDKFCVASEGYRELFMKKGIPSKKLEVTGIPNFDNCKEYLTNDFPYRNYVLAATSDSRETFKPENRKRFIKRAAKIAGRKMLIFKLHPNENFERAVKEIKKYAPNALIYTSGNAEEMVANCDVLITRYSTLAYVGILLGKKVYSYFKIIDLMKLVPLQNEGMSAYNISVVARTLIEEQTDVFKLKVMKERLSLVKSRTKRLNEKSSA